MERLRFATVWLGGCAGCHMSFLDLDEFLLELAGRIDLVYSPIADVKIYPADVDVCLVEGAICNVDHVELIHQVRARTRVVVSFGDCAVTGNVPSLRNVLGAKNADDVLQRAYIEAAETNAVKPALDGILPPLLPRVLPVRALIKVDHFLPGCPPPADRIKAILLHVLDGAPALTGSQLKFG
ncbi:MAG: oxidoreductase [Opitutus sp.]|nr:oxidoreductase [Opitutus sp.]